MQPDRFSAELRGTLQLAQQLAMKLAHAQVVPEHVLAALHQPEESAFAALLQRCGISRAQAQAHLDEALRGLPSARPGELPVLSPRLKQAMDAAVAELDLGENLGIGELLDAMARKDHRTMVLLARWNLDARVIAQTLSRLLSAESSSTSCPNLTKYTRDLTELARAGKLDPIIGREGELRRVMQVLSRRTKNNPVLIGEPGVGKTALAEGVAHRIARGDVPEPMKKLRILALDLAAMVAGTQYRGMFEERMTGLLAEVRRCGDVVLFIDEVHVLIGTGKAEGADGAANMLKPALARGELRCIGATTLDEYRKHIEKDAALERRFQPVLVPQPTVADTIGILRGLKERYEAHHGVRIQDAALVAAATLSDRYISERFLPDKAIDLVDESASDLRMEIDSLPEEIDALQRQITQLEIEQRAIAKEEGVDAGMRRRTIADELAGLRTRRDEMRDLWTREKDQVQRLSKKRAELEDARRESGAATRAGDLGRAAELQYTVIPQLQAALEQLQQELGTSKRFLREQVTAETIAQVVARWTGIPVTRMLQSEQHKLLDVEATLRRRVVGQDEAVRAVAAAVKRARVGLGDEGRPLGSFLFLGPTGVGKTELAKALAEFLFDDERAMVRLDMSEYVSAASVQRMVGAPPGHLGFDEGGQLTEAVRRRPFSVVLFDEVEKANPDVWNALLQVLDDGRLTDGHGRTVNFKNTVLILTSNAGSAALEGLTDPGARRRAAMESLRQSFRPEFLNRLDEVTVFRPLGREHLAQVVNIQLERLHKRLERVGLAAHFDPEAIALLAELGWDPAYGARPLKRAIQQHVENPLSDKMLEGEIQEGNTLRVFRAGDGLRFEAVASN